MKGELCSFGHTCPLDTLFLLCIHYTTNVVFCQILINNKEKDNSNSLIKTFRSIKTNTIDLDNKNYYEFINVFI